MSLRIAGMGWVTPLGRGIDAVWEQLLCGHEAKTEIISNDSSRGYPFFAVPGTALKNLPPHPRLRRAGSISRFAAAAGMDAVKDASLTNRSGNPERMALIFAVSNGGVIYTKRFYRDIVDSGARSASPLIFPETVFNAPASHLASMLGITGTSYTLVGDGAVGLLALKMAEDLMSAASGPDYCLVVGAEEADWIICNAYNEWRLLKRQAPVDLFRDPPRGMIPGEGAGAVLLARGEGEIAIEQIDPGANFSHQRDAAALLDKIVSRLATRDSAVLIGSANGTFVDLAEQITWQKRMPAAAFYSPKPALGEGIGAGAIWQVIAAAQALRTQRLPPVLHVDTRIKGDPPMSSAREISGKEAVVLSCGLNQQAAGLRLVIARH